MTATDRMRMFVAVVPPENAIEDLDEFLEVRRAFGAFRWSSAEQFHLTLAFCAEVPKRHLDDFCDRLTRAAKKRRSFTTRLHGGGAFPNPAKARVLWAGLDLDEAAQIELSRAATGARAAATKAGVEVDGTRFTPHLTVARLGRPAEVSKWVQLLDSYVGPTWPAQGLTLIASHLGEGPRNRPRYEVVGEFPFSA